MFIRDAELISPEFYIRNSAYYLFYRLAVVKICKEFFYKTVRSECRRIIKSIFYTWFFVFFGKFFIVVFVFRRSSAYFKLLNICKLLGQRVAREIARVFRGNKDYHF